MPIHRGSDYKIGLSDYTPAIGPNKSKKLNTVTAPAHNIYASILMKKQYTWLHRHFCEAMYIAFSFKLCRVYWCRRYMSCEFLGFVCTDCWGNLSSLESCGARFLAPRPRNAPLPFAPTRTGPKSSKFYCPDPGPTRLHFPRTGPTRLYFSRTGPDRNNIASTRN